ncbi:MAG: type II secretion system protein GspM [Mariprofundales bacterium]|nr:type II secretion system protein GspM [Mariprofundales bacterium]
MVREFLRIYGSGQGILLRVKMQFLPYYQRLSAREQYLLIVVAIVLPALLFVMGVWQPVVDQINTLEGALPKLQGQLHEAQRLADRLQTLGRGGSGTAAMPSNALESIEQAAAMSGIRKNITRIKPDIGMGGAQRMRIIIHSAPYPVMIKFLFHLIQKGIILAKVQMVATDTPGQLNAVVLVMTKG